MSENLPQPHQENEPSGEILALIKLGQEFISLQGREIEVKKTEIEANKEIAIASIEAQKEVAGHDRKHEGGQETRRYIFVFAIVLVVVGATLALVFNNAKDLVIEIIKTLLTFAAGAFGGVQYGKVKALEKEDKDE
jgi:sorbitol-specific phosphotransferase system component IIBC